MARESLGDGAFHVSIVFAVLTTSAFINAAAGVYQKDVSFRIRADLVQYIADKRMLIAVITGSPSLPCMETMYRNRDRVGVAVFEVGKDRHSWFGWNATKARVDGDRLTVWNQQEKATSLRSVSLANRFRIDDGFSQSPCPPSGTRSFGALSCDVWRVISRFLFAGDLKSLGHSCRFLRCMVQDMLGFRLSKRDVASSVIPENAVPSACGTLLVQFVSPDTVNAFSTASGEQIGQWKVPSYGQRHRNVKRVDFGAVLSPSGAILATAIACKQ